MFKGRNAQGRTIGIIGIGNVGRRVARICGKGIEMRVLAYDPYLTDAEIEARGAVPVQILRGERPPRLINPEAWGKFSMRFEQAFKFKSA